MMRQYTVAIFLLLSLALVAAACGDTANTTVGATSSVLGDPVLGIVFHSDRDGNGEVYVMDADGSNPTRLTDNPALELLPKWSPDGTKIAFI